MTLQNSARALLTRIGEAIAVRFAAKAVRQGGRSVATPAQLAATVDPWIPEEQWLAGFFLPAVASTSVGCGGRIPEALVARSLPHW
jgi:hypothetical protein